MNKEIDGEYLKKESEITANIVIDALVDAGVIKKKDMDLAAEIAAEEILVRRSMEQL